MTRHELMRQLSDLLHDRTPEAGHVGVMLIRLQRLSEFRIVYGFGASDELADAAEQRIRRVLRPADSLHRIDEHEFVAFLPGLRDRNHAVLAAGAVARAFQVVLPLGTREALVSVAVGTSVCPDHGDDPETLLRRAELAFGQAGVECVEGMGGGEAEQRQVAKEHRKSGGCEWGGAALRCLVRLLVLPSFPRRR